MRNKTKVLIMVLVMAIMMTTAVYAGVELGRSEVTATMCPDVGIVLKNETLTLKDANGDIVSPIIYQGTTYLPIRAISEAQGLEVGWDGDTTTVYVDSDMPVAEVVEEVVPPNVVAATGGLEVNGEYYFTADQLIDYTMNEPVWYTEWSEVQEPNHVLLAKIFMLDLYASTGDPQLEYKGKTYTTGYVNNEGSSTNGSGYIPEFFTVLEEGAKRVKGTFFYDGNIQMYHKNSDRFDCFVRIIANCDIPDYSNDDWIVREYNPGGIVLWEGHFNPGDIKSFDVDVSGYDTITYDFYTADNSGLAKDHNLYGLVDFRYTK